MCAYSDFVPYKENVRYDCSANLFLFLAKFCCFVSTTLQVTTIEFLPFKTKAELEKEAAEQQQQQAQLQAQQKKQEQELREQQEQQQKQQHEEKNEDIVQFSESAIVPAAAGDQKDVAQPATVGGDGDGDEVYETDVSAAGDDSDDDEDNESSGNNHQYVSFDNDDILAENNHFIALRQEFPGVDVLSIAEELKEELQRVRARQREEEAAEVAAAKDLPPGHRRRVHQLRTRISRQELEHLVRKKIVEAQRLEHKQQERMKEESGKQPTPQVPQAKEEEIMINAQEQQSGAGAPKAARSELKEPTASAEQRAIDRVRQQEQARRHYQAQVQARIDREAAEMEAAAAAAAAQAEVANKRQQEEEKLRKEEEGGSIGSTDKPDVE